MFVDCYTTTNKEFIGTLIIGAVIGFVISLVLCTFIIPQSVSYQYVEKTNKMCGGVGKVPTKYEASNERQDVYKCD